MSSTAVAFANETVWVFLGEIKIGFRESVWIHHSPYLKNAINDHRKMQTPVTDEKTPAIAIHLPFKLPPATLSSIQPFLQYIGESDLGMPHPECASHKTLLEFFKNDKTIVDMLLKLFPNDYAATVTDAKNKRAALKEPIDSICPPVLTDALNLVHLLQMDHLNRIFSGYVAFMYHKQRTTTAHLAVSK